MPLAVAPGETVDPGQRQFVFGGRQLAFEQREQLAESLFSLAAHRVVAGLVGTELPLGRHGAGDAAEDDCQVGQQLLGLGRQLVAGALTVGEGLEAEHLRSEVLDRFEHVLVGQQQRFGVDDLQRMSAFFGRGGDVSQAELGVDGIECACLPHARVARKGRYG